MSLTIKGQVGPRAVGDGAENEIRLDKTSALIVSDAHGRLQEAALRGKLFSAGMTITSISNATFSTGTLTATCTPIIGVWNPPGSGKNLVILQARVQLINTALQVTGAGALVWAVSSGQSAISTGIVPLNRLSLANSGAIGKGFAGTALTGLSGSLIVQEVAALGGLLSNLSTLQTAAGLMPLSPAFVDNIDGAFIVPPGGVLALLCTTNAPVAVSAASSILWEEVDI
jgi:hypothetical protein